MFDPVEGYAGSQESLLVQAMDAVTLHEQENAPEVDWDRVRQVVVNLVGNSIKFTERGEVAIRLSFSSRDREGGLLRVDVSDFAALRTLDEKVIVTAPGDDCDFVSRFFAPTAGVPEDPVTGSSHCTLIPYWSRRLGKTTLFARQLSKRGGELFCRLAGERVHIGGKAVLYSRGQIEIDDAAARAR